MDILILIASIFLGLIILTVLVAIHELGHGIAARRNGVVVEEFGIGFPPRAWARKVKQSLLGKNVEYTLNWLPLGGFVKLQGEHDADSGKGDYGAATFWQKTKILLAGVAVNWIAAAVLLTLLAPFGVPKILPNQFSVAADTVTVNEAPEISQVQEGSPAAEIGLQNGDAVLAINGQQIETATGLIDTTKAEAGNEISVTFERDGQERTESVTLRDTQAGEREGYLGAGIGQREYLRSTWSSPIVGVGLTAQFTWLTLDGLGDTLVKFVSGLFQSISLSEETRQDGGENLSAAGQNVAGPVGLIGGILPRLIEAGPIHIIFITAIISLSLAVINTLPIPALDGGRWFLTALFRLIKKPLTAEREEAINAIGFLGLMALFVLITIADIGKL